MRRNGRQPVGSQDVASETARAVSRGISCPGCGARPHPKSGWSCRRTPPTSPKTRPPVSGISWACADLVAADNSARATRTGSNSVLHFKTAISTD